MKNILVKIIDFIVRDFEVTSEIKISILDVVILIVILLLTSFVLRKTKKVAVKRLKEDNKNKFDTIFSFASWFFYVIIFLVTLQSVGVNVTAILAASAALLIGVGLALQTFFQDIISGIFIIFDETVHVGDVIEINNKVGRVIEIKLRTTRIVTTEHKVLVVPNHLYLTNSLYNWTQNGTITRESITVGVAYGSDVELVKKLLIEAAMSHPKVFQHPAPTVLFTDFGDSALQFKLIFTLNDSLWVSIPQSEIRFIIERLFRENGIEIPFPQRDIHIRTNNIVK
ncbi:MAG: mechanosensitive ion channel [Tenacibaculum sp.]|nr:mechanosensitive ion channel [Tenacibaculum sp.]